MCRLKIEWVATGFLGCSTWTVNAFLGRYRLPTETIS